MKEGLVLGELLVYLFPCMLTDIRRSEIPLKYVLPAGSGLILLNLFVQPVSRMDMLAGAAAGVLLLLAAVLSRGSLGIGDGILLVFTGAAAGLRLLIPLLLQSLIVLAVSGLIRKLIRREKGFKQRLPFVPFLYGAAAAELAALIFAACRTRV